MEGPVSQIKVLRPLFAAALLSGVLLTGCAMPRVPGFASYHVVTDPASGQTWYTAQLRREKGGVVEFRDGATGAWVSVPEAQVRDISAAEYRAATGR
jgi:hypothetical protein